MQIRVGLNSGEVVVRAIGSDLHMDYTAVGQTTHLAARMEQLAEPGTTLLAPATLWLAEGYVQVTPRGPVPVKGLAEPVEVYALTGPAPVRSRLQAAAARGLTRVRRPRRELDDSGGRSTLAQAAGTARSSPSSASPGVGKSRLVWEFTHSHRAQGWLVLEAGSVSYGKAHGLPAGDRAPARRYFQIEARDDARTHPREGDGQAPVPRPRPGADPARAAARSSTSRSEDAPWQALDPAQRRQRTLDARQASAAPGEPGPAAAAASSRTCTGSTPRPRRCSTAWSRACRPPGCCSWSNYRPEYSTRWGSKTYYQQLRLDPLPRGERRRAARRAPRGRRQRSESLKRTARRADARAIRSSSRRACAPWWRRKALAGERGAYRLARTDADAIQVPATVAGDPRRAHRPAGAGRQAPAPGGRRHRQGRALRAAARRSPSCPRRTCGAGLAHLQAAEFLYETRLFPDLEYTFKHALTHEVAYQGLLHDRQRALHARIAEAIERLAPERVAEQAERLAHHALRGELWEKAVAYLRQAGLRAMARAANREAIAHLEQALGALRRLPETRETTELTIDIRLDLRNALLPLGDRARMGEHLHEAEVLARTLGDQHRLARIATFMVIQCLVTGDYDEAVRFGQEALSIARTLGDRSIEVVATSFLGMTHAARGEFSDAATFLERNVALEGDLRYERFGAPVIQSALSGAYLADVLSQLGRFDEAIGHAEAAVRIAEAADHPFTLYFGLFDLGLAHLRRGDLPRATRVLERGLDLCRTWQFVVGTPLVAATLGAAYALAGRADEALPLVAGAVEEFRSRQIHNRPALILLCAGMTYLSAGRIDEAASHAREALALTRRLGARGSEAHALCLAGDVASTGGAEDAEGYYREALALAGELGMRPLVAHCHLGLGKLYRRTGKREQAREHLTTATTMYREMDMRFWLEQAEAEMREVA